MIRGDQHAPVAELGQCFEQRARVARDGRASWRGAGAGTRLERVERDAKGGDKDLVAERDVLRKIVSKERLSAYQKYHYTNY